MIRLENLHNFAQRQTGSQDPPPIPGPFPTVWRKGAGRVCIVSTRAQQAVPLGNATNGDS